MNTRNHTAAGTTAAGTTAAGTTARTAALSSGHPAQRVPIFVATALALALASSGCSLAGDAEPLAAPDAPLAVEAGPESNPPAARSEGEPADEPDAPDVAPGDAWDGPARVARATGHLDVHEAPGSDTVTHTLERLTSFDTPTVLLVVDDDEGWLEVLLPVRPNGTTGWIRAGDVEVSEVAVAVEVDLEARSLTVLEAGEVVLTTTVAIGDAEHPTPTGTFSVTDKLDTGDPDGPYGPYALGLSGRSDVLTEFAGGDGQIGIHGTNDPSSIGEAASHGCLRVDNEVVEQLVHLLPLGTPVTVT